MDNSSFLTGNTFQAGQVMTNLPQIQFVQTGPNQYIQQQCIPQQYIMQPLATQIPGIQSNNGDTKTPQAILPALSASQANNQTVRITTNNLQIKGTATVAPFMGQKQQRGQISQQKTQPLIFGALSILPNQFQQQNIYSLNQQQSQQCTTLNLNGPLRFSPNFLNMSQLIASPNGALLNLGQFQVNSPLLVANQGGPTTLLGSQPLYIRTTTDAYNNATIFQNVAPTPQIKNAANIAPHQPMVNHVTPVPKISTPKLQNIAKCSALVTSSTQLPTVVTPPTTCQQKLQCFSSQNIITTATMPAVTTEMAIASENIVTSIIAKSETKEIVVSTVAPVVSSTIVVGSTFISNNGLVATTKAVATVCSEQSIRSAPIIVVQPKLQESEKSDEDNLAVKNLLLVSPDKNYNLQEDLKDETIYCDIPTPIKIIENYTKKKKVPTATLR